MNIRLDKALKTSCHKKQNRHIKGFNKNFDQAEGRLGRQSTLHTIIHRQRSARSCLCRENKRFEKECRLRKYFSCLFDVVLPLKPFCVLVFYAPTQVVGNGAKTGDNNDKLNSISFFSHSMATGLIVETSLTATDKNTLLNLRCLVLLRAVRRVVSTPSIIITCNFALVSCRVASRSVTPLPPIFSPAGDWHDRIEEIH